MANKILKYHCLSADELEEGWDLKEKESWRILEGKVYVVFIEGQKVPKSSCWMAGVTSRLLVRLSKEPLLWNRSMMTTCYPSFKHLKISLYIYMYLGGGGLCTVSVTRKLPRALTCKIKRIATIFGPWKINSDLRLYIYNMDIPYNSISWFGIL